MHTKKHQHLLKIYIFLGLILWGITPLERAAAQSQPAAQISDLVYEQTSDGIWIRFTLEVQNMSGQEVRVGLWAVNAESGEFVRMAGSDQTYSDPKGLLTLQDVVTPNYDNTIWDTSAGKAFKLFIPFSAFPGGNYSWYPYIEVQDNANGNDFLEGNNHFTNTVIPMQSGSQSGGSKTVYKVTLLPMYLYTTNREEQTSGEDEVVLTYLLAENETGSSDFRLDGQSKLGSWSYDNVKEGKYFGPFPALEIWVKDGSGFGVSFVLNETEDYSSAKKYSDSVSKWSGRVGTAATIGAPLDPSGTTAAIASAAEAVKLVSDAAGLAIDVVGFFDDNDELGDSRYGYSSGDVSYLKNLGNGAPGCAAKEVIWSGSNNFDDFKYVFNYTVCVEQVAFNASTGKISGGTPLSTYEITFYTPDISDAGTDASVMIAMFGDKYGSSTKLPAFLVDTPDKNDFERGNYDKFIVGPTQSLGEISSIQVFLSDTGEDNEWYLEWVVVEDLSLNRRWEFYCQCWFDGGVKDYYIEVAQ